MWKLSRRKTFGLLSDHNGSTRVMLTLQEPRRSHHAGSNTNHLGGSGQRETHWWSCTPMIRKKLKCFGHYIDNGEGRALRGIGSQSQGGKLTIAPHLSLTQIRAPATPGIAKEELLYRFQ